MSRYIGCVFSTKVLIWGHYFYVSNWKRDRHFTRSSEPREGLAACTAKAVPLFLSHFKTLTIGPASEIEPATPCSAVLSANLAALRRLHFDIAGLYVTSRRPCWWSRTKAFLLLLWELNSIFMSILRGNILLFWPPTWPKIQPYRNAKIQPYLQNFCTASHCKITANHFWHLWGKNFPVAIYPPRSSKMLCAAHCA